MDSRMERWGVGVCWEEENTSAALTQDFIDGGKVGFIQDMEELLEMPREVAVELWTQADEGFVGNDDRLDKHHAIKTCKRGLSELWPPRAAPLPPPGVS